MATKEQIARREAFKARNAHRLQPLHNGIADTGTHNAMCPKEYEHKPKERGK